MSQLDHIGFAPAGYAISAAAPAPTPTASRATYPASSSNGNASTLSEVASAALADVGPSSSGASDSSQDSERQRVDVMQLVPGSSNGSADGSQTDDTSPKSAQSVVRKAVDDDARSVQRPYTPEQRGVGAHPTHESPPLKQGAKRTASGAVKPTDNGYVAASQAQSYAPRGHVRAKSSSRAVEISSALKARLAYAMVKVRSVDTQCPSAMC